MPQVWVSDTRSHFGDLVLANLDEVLKVDHQYGIAYTAWTSGTCEQMVKEVTRTSNSILSEGRRLVLDWVHVNPTVQLI